MWGCAATGRGGLLLAVAAAAGIAACGGHVRTSSPSATGTRNGQAGRPTGANASQTATSAAGHSHRRGRSRATPKVHGPKVGATQAVHAFGSSLHVTVTRVVAVGQGQAALPPGDRGVAVKLRIADEAGATYDSTASGDLSVIVSHGMAAPLDIRSGPCATQLVDFESHLYSGDVRTGCVGFSVPRSARVLGVRFSPHARARGSVTWRAGR